MKIDRLIGIVSVLLQKGKLTVPQLASKFEVSRRTINRDILDLCKAGIPIVTVQGPNGGIMLMKEYTIDKILLTTAEMQSILYGLQSLDGVTGNHKYRQLLDKLSVHESDILQVTEYMILDFSSRSMQSQKDTIQRLQKAIIRNKLVSFDYYSPKQTTNRVIEPYLLIFRWNSWYLWGYCKIREDYRLFKILRIKNLNLLEETFSPKKVKEPEDVSINWDESERFLVQAAFEPEIKWRLLEEFDCEQMKFGEDGRIYVDFSWSEKDSLLIYLLSYGKEIEVIGPQELREEYIQLVNQMIKRYQ